jgi:hypothetical protein
MKFQCKGLLMKFSPDHKQTNNNDGRGWVDVVDQQGHPVPKHKIEVADSFATFPRMITAGTPTALAEGLTALVGKFIEITGEVGHYNGKDFYTVESFKAV